MLYKAFHRVFTLQQRPLSHVPMCLLLVSKKGLWLFSVIIQSAKPLGYISVMHFTSHSTYLMNSCCKSMNPFPEGEKALLLVCFVAYSSSPLRFCLCYKRIFPSLANTPFLPIQVRLIILKKEKLRFARLLSFSFGVAFYPQRLPIEWESKFPWLAPAECRARSSFKWFSSHCCVGTREHEDWKHRRQGPKAARQV